jgi:N-acetyl-anhydromuramyl-L-alanine amidase AmpD
MKYDEIFIELPAGKPGFNLKPELIVLHASAEWVWDFDEDKYYHILSYHKHKGWSAHYYVFQNNLLVKCKKDIDMAYHAAGHNKNSIGIEFIMPGFHTYEMFIDAIDGQWLLREQLDIGLDVVKKLIYKYRIKEITTHHELDPDRKYDPGHGFPTDQFKRLIP